ncbi:MAG: hypothetical protein NXI10_09835 [bacterium]|nr:hypothetical protein [bacterium]
MKFLILLITVLTSHLASSQLFYESPFVVNGTSFRFTIPPGFEEMNEEDHLEDGNPNVAAYTTQQLYEAQILFPRKTNLLYISNYETNDTIAKENGITELYDIYSMFSDSVILEKDTLTTNNFDTFSISTYTIFSSFGDIELSMRIYEAECQFDSISFSVHLAENIREGQSFLDPSFFRAILKSYRVYETDRNSTFIRKEEWEEKIHNH